MSPVLILVAVTFHLQIVSGIRNGYGKVTVRIQRGKPVILKCLSSGVMRSWLGPDGSNFTNEQAVIYFSNFLKNPKLNMSKYSVQAKNGNYDLTIFNFQKADTGLYICRCFNDHDNGTFYETKYNVSLLASLMSFCRRMECLVYTNLDEGVSISTMGYERIRDLENAPGIQVNVKETSSQLPAKQRHPKPNSNLTISLIVVFLLVISLALLGFIARRKWGTLGRKMLFFIVSFKGDAERTILAEDTREQHDSIDEPAEQSEGLNYVEVLTEPLTPRQTRIRGTENRIMYTEIDHSLKS